MHFKIIVLIILAVILISLGISFYFIIKDNGQTNRAVKTLSWCLLLCAALLVFLLIGVSRGWLIPPGI